MKLNEKRKKKLQKIKKKNIKHKCVAEWLESWGLLSDHNDAT